MSAVQQSQESHSATNTENSKQDSPTQNDQVHAASPESGNVDKIREILFGGQMRDYDKRFHRLEERLLKETADLRANHRRGIEALEVFVKNELAALTTRLQTEQQNREGSIHGLAREIHEALKALDNKLTQFNNQTIDTQRDLRQQLLDQSKSLNDEIHRKHQDVSVTLERELAGLNHEKADRASLSALFTELAMRLNNDFKIPGETDNQS